MASVRTVHVPWRAARFFAAAHACRGLHLARNGAARRRGFAATPQLPSQARVVVVGGGIIGTSTAYHLAKSGWDVVLLERDRLTSGTTWHAAGLMVTFGSLSETSTELRKYTKELYSTILPAETGMDTGFKPCGFIELATTPDRLEEYRRIAAFNRKCGVDVREISAAEVGDLFPLCRTDDILCGFYVETDGRVNPVDATMALAKGARLHGATIVEGCEVTGITKDAGRVTGVTTSTGEAIKAEYVVNCAGMWARQFGELCGVNVPNQAAEHYYLITEAMETVDPNWPVVEDPANYTYIRPEGGGLMVGLFEGEGAAWNVKGIPSDSSFTEINPDWERLAPYLEAAMSRVPSTMEVGAKNFFCGPESFTPDLSPIVGEAPELRNYFVCAGLNSIGILTGGGMGNLMAQWIMNGYSTYDITGINIDRFHNYQANPAYRAERVNESLGKVYKSHMPNAQYRTCRNNKRSPIHDRLVQRGAFFKNVSGWEGADWFAGEGKEAKTDGLSWGRESWFPQWKTEHEACRSGVILMDMSFMSKFLVQGRDAGACLNRLSTANVDGAAGEIVYTQWLNERGKLEADLTVMKLATDKFIVTDVTGSYAQLNVQGPKSRQLLQELVDDADMSDAAFPFRTAREVAIGYARPIVTRITYLGELGFEIYIPTEQAMHVYDRITEVGEREEHGLVHAGLKALASLRMEKGYRDYGHDLDNTDTLLEAGLGFTADFEKPGGFIGMEAVQAQKAAVGSVAKLPKRMIQVLLDDPEPFLHHGEVVYRDGKIVGDVRAGSFGHTLGSAVGLVMCESVNGEPVNKAYIENGKWEVDIAGVKYSARASLRPWYDPDNERIKM